MNKDARDRIQFGPSEVRGKRRKRFFISVLIATIIAFTWYSISNHFKQINIKNQNKYQEAIALASQGNLKEAVAVIKTIDSNSDIHEEASKKLRKWEKTIASTEEAIRDQSTMQKAFDLATDGNLVEAIKVAKTISKNSKKYDISRKKVEQWSLKHASILATQNNYIDAIKMANTISKESKNYEKVREKIQQWEKKIK